VEFDAELKPLLLSMTPKNDSMAFEPPQNDEQLSQSLLKHYAKNTHLRDLDTRQDPGHVRSVGE
jgi:hypothetical protein